LLRQRSRAIESADADRPFRFDGSIALPLIGMIVHSNGTLKQVEMSWQPWLIQIAVLLVVTDSLFDQATALV
jgi:hypothetical protein